MYFAVLYGLPMIVGASLVWTVNNVRGEYAEWALLGLLGIAATLFTAAFTQIITKIVKSTSAGKRRLVASTFRPLLLLVQFNCIIVTIGFGLAVTASSFFVPVMLTGYYLPKLTFFFAIAAVYVTFKICSLLISARPKATTSTTGTLLGRSQANELWSVVDDLSMKLNTAPPERIVLTIENKICVTEAEVQIGKQIYQGRTLIISLPLLKNMHNEQCKAIIAHELAHFSGRHTQLSLRFFPIYKGAIEARSSIAKAFDKFGATSLGALPAMLLLDNFLKSFGEIESEISRQCEKEADTSAAAVTGHTTMVKALINIHALSHCWQQCDQFLFGLLHAEGKATDNIIAFFSNTLNESSAKKAADIIVGSAIPHPFNSHPTLRQRIEYLGETVEALKDISLTNDTKNTLITSIQSIENIEVSLSSQENEKNAMISKIIHESSSAKKAA